LSGNNTLKAEVVFKDGLGREYKSESSCIVKSEAKGINKFWQFVNSIGNWIVGVFE